MKKAWEIMREENFEGRMKIKVGYCTGFWCTNIGNGFFGLGTKYVLDKIFGVENITVISDMQSYTNSIGKRVYRHSNQIEYISQSKVDYVVLSGPVLSKYFLKLWKDILLKLNEYGVKYIIVNAGTMKLNKSEEEDIRKFFYEVPPYIFISRDDETFSRFSQCAENAYNGICMSFFAPDYYFPCELPELQPYFLLNFDKTPEPKVWFGDAKARNYDYTFQYREGDFYVRNNPIYKITSKTDHFTDALIYAVSILPASRKPDSIGEYKIIRTDHRFYPHYRNKIYKYSNSYCADLPYGYINLYANCEATLSDRVHACAVALAYGKSAMLFAKTNRAGLLERVGAFDVLRKPTTINKEMLTKEKEDMIRWFKGVIMKDSE